MGSVFGKEVMDLVDRPIKEAHLVVVPVSR